MKELSPDFPDLIESFTSNQVNFRETPTPAPAAPHVKRHSARPGAVAVRDDPQVQIPLLRTEGNRRPNRRQEPVAELLRRLHHPAADEHRVQVKDVISHRQYTASGLG